MSEFPEKRITSEQRPVDRGNRVVDTGYRPVVRDDRRMSAGAIVALVLAAVAAAIAITMLVMNGRQKTNDELKQDEARTAAAEQPSAQPPQQAPPIVVPQSQPTPAIPPPSEPANAVQPTSIQLEIDVNSTLLDDQDLRLYPIDVKVSGGTATLSGHVPTVSLKKRAEILTRSVKDIKAVVNNIVVRAD